MARPRKLRRVCYFPEISRFSPCGAEKQGKPITMTVDEFESVRLIDWEGLSQEDCARRMGVARTTVQMIYVSARRKLAAMLVEGVSGDYFNVVGLPVSRVYRTLRELGVL